MSQTAVEDHKRKFIDFALQRGVLRFGEFTLKSGRRSPYFFNAGLFATGAALARLGRYYARAIVDSGVGFDMLFGPAYKGIPLAAASAVALAEAYDRDVPFAFNRKEAKDHGEGGRVIGAPVAGRVLIVDDVISAGTSVGESAALIAAAGARLVGVAVALDRQERGQQQRSAAQEVAVRYAVPVIAIANLDALVAYLHERGDRGDELAALAAYRREFGVS